MRHGVVFDIQRFAIHDGPGIRTTVFLKGCPLHCLWCHNPESQDPRPEIFFNPGKCIGCRACELACEQGAHTFEPDLDLPLGLHRFNRDACIRCGECTLECYAQALEISGASMSVEEVLAQVVKDRAFYQTSGGGMTLSGGEPLAQAEFTRALLREARTAGLHTVVETSGCGQTAHYLEILPDVDLFYFDFKESDPERHRQATGISNTLILHNLSVLDQAGAEIVLRCPIIPGLNDRADHFEAIGRLASQYPHVKAVHILPYHPLGTSKSQRLGKAVALDIKRPAEEHVRAWVEAVTRATSVPVLRD